MKCKYLEFAVASNFSFLRGASHAEELMLQAQTIGLDGIGLCDRNTVAGVVRAHLIKRDKDLKLNYHPGARLVFADDTPDILVYPRDRAAWGRLTRLLTRGNLRAEKGDCILFLEDLLEFSEGLELIVMERTTRDAPVRPLKNLETPPASPNPPPTFGAAKLRVIEGTKRPPLLARLRDAAPGRVRLATVMLYNGNDRKRLARRAEMARQAGIPLIAVNDVLYHTHERRELQDVVTCIREHLTIDQAGRRLAANAERHLKPPRDMARLFRDAPEALAETLRLDEVLTFSLDELRYEYPDESVPGFASPQATVEHLALQGAKQRYPKGITKEVLENLEKEFGLIAKREYAPYFLTVYDIVRYARSIGILCQGRGSAANSTVCYCMGITSVDPIASGLLFERFISTEREEPPDIDIDFEHERREEVIQYIYRKYGRARAGIAATVISYRGRSAIREVGKVFGLSEDTIGALSSSIWGMGGGSVRESEIKRAGIDTASPRMQKLRALTQQIQSFPRHLSQHVGGFVITRSPLDEVVPIMNGAMDNRTHVEWDKDDLDALGILKVDVLGLGMLTCIRKAFELCEKHYGKSFQVQPLQDSDTPREAVIGYDLATVPPEEDAVYHMVQRADTIGVFQIESRAQMSMLPRLRPECFYDLVIEVAIVRPGPIQGNMVHPYLRRRERLRLTGEEPQYPSPSPPFDKDELKLVLKKTLGVPLFQEQAMKIAMVAGGFSASEADKLRRAMATFKRTGKVGEFKDRMVSGMTAKGYPRDFAERCFSQIEGFGEYGFPESHAASFALLVYASAWLKCRYPDVFAAALLNSQPMGFYAPAQIVRDLREHGVDVRPVDINHSDWDTTLEEGPSTTEQLHDLHRGMAGEIRTTHVVRLGFSKIKGLSEAEHGNPIMEQRGTGYASVRDLWLRTGLPQRVIERLADADAFGSLGLTRRQALWAAKALGRVGDRDDDLPLFSVPVVLPTAPLVDESESPLEQADATETHEPWIEPHVDLPPMPLGEEVVNDYRFLSLSLRAHPASFLRPDLERRGIIRNAALWTKTNDARVRVSGLVTIRQRPGSADGVVFMTIEDESAIANIIVWPSLFERFRPIILGARYLGVEGIVQHASGVIHVVAHRLVNLTHLLAGIAETGATIESLSRADEVKRGPDDREDNRTRGRRRAPFSAPQTELTTLIASDLDVPARGSAHAPGRRGGA